jgi:hypothetical protein
VLLTQVKAVSKHATHLAGVPWQNCKGELQATLAVLLSVPFTQAFLPLLSAQTSALATDQPLPSELQVWYVVEVEASPMHSTWPGVHALAQ